MFVFVFQCVLLHNAVGFMYIYIRSFLRFLFCTDIACCAVLLLLLFAYLLYIYIYIYIYFATS